MKHLTRLSSLVAASIIGVAIAGAAGMIILHQAGDQLLSVASPSMEPLIRSGDVVVVESVKFTDLRAGDIVSYRSQIQPNKIITHRIVNIDTSRGMITTAGDNHRGIDRTITENQIVGRVSARAPLLGRVFAFFKRPIGLALFVYLPATILIISELFSLNRRLTGPSYLLDYNYDSE